MFNNLFTSRKTIKTFSQSTKAEKKKKKKIIL